MEHLPVVNLEPFLDDPFGPEGQRFVDALRGHLHMTGFVQVVGHGVDPALDRKIIEVGQEFFALPEAERRSLEIGNSAAFRGYTILGDERTGGSADWRDQLDYGPEQDAPSPGHEGPAWLRLRGPNQWPPSLPHLAGTALEWMEAVHGVGLAMVRAIALGLGQDIDRFDAGFVPEHDLHVKIIRYPGLAETPAPARPDGADPAEPTFDQGVGLHHDTGVATLILQNGVAGLEVLVDDEFVSAEPVDGAYVFNLGAMMQSATNGYLRATPHRVRSPQSGTDRLSVALFFNPTFESTFDPVELPASLAADARPDRTDFAGDQIHTLFGENNLKVRLRSHPDVAARHYADI